MVVVWIVALLLMITGWTAGTIITIQMLRNAGVELDLPAAKKRLIAVIGTTFALPLVLPMALLWRGAQKLKLPLPQALKLQNQLQFLEDWASQRAWEVVERAASPDEAPAGTLLLHCRSKDNGNELAIHKHRKGYVFSIWYDLRHKLPLAMASLPHKPSPHPLLPHWQTAINSARGPRLVTPRSSYAEKHDFFGELLHYYGLIGRGGFEYIEWHHSSLVRNWYSEQGEYRRELPFNYDHVALAQGFLLLQHTTRLLSQDFEKAQSFVKRLEEHLLLMCTTNDPTLLGHGIKEHLIAHKKGRLTAPEGEGDDNTPPTVFLKTCLERLQQSCEGSQYRNALRNISRSDFPDVEDILAPHINAANMSHELIQFAQSIKNPTNERCQVLSNLRKAIPLGQLRPILASIFKAQGNHQKIQEQALSVWSKYYTKEDLHELRERSIDAGFPEILVMIKCIGKYGGAKDEPFLLEQLAHKDAMLRLEAIEALGSCGSSNVLHALQEHSKNSPRNERQATTAAIQAIRARSPQLEGGGLSLAVEDDSVGQLSIAEAQEEGQLSVGEEST